MSNNQNFGLLVRKLNDIRVRLKKKAGEIRSQTSFNKDLILYLDNLEEQILLLEHEVRILKNKTAEEEDDWR